MRKYGVGALASAAVLAGMLAAAPPAAAAPKKKPPAVQESESEREARRLYGEGDKLYAEGDYEGAVKAFGKAYELSQRPALKYNLANAYERLGRYEEAHEALRDYEPHASADERPVVQRRIEKLAERAEQQRREKASASTAKSAEDADASHPPSSDRPPEPAPDSQKAPIAGYALLGVGVVGLGLGTFFGLQALSSRSDAEDQCAEGGGVRRCPAAAQDALDTNQRNALIADISLGVGIVATAVGAYIVFKGSSQESATVVRAEARRNGGGLSLAATF
jgi:tetratricopeptide (TPR) repeat protein